MKKREIINLDRNNNIDLFKCILMAMIVAHHAIVHGLGMKNIIDNSAKMEYSFLYFITNAFLVIAVNCFFWDIWLV
mgnify:CR=1 FL=1